MKTKKPLKPKRAIFGSIRINYTEPDPKTYKSVGVYTRDGKGKQIQEETFATGDANYDYHCAMLWLGTARCEVIMGSSSCDHFQMDGGKINMRAKGLKLRLREYLATLNS